MSWNTSKIVQFILSKEGIEGISERKDEMGAKGVEGSVYCLEIAYTVYRKIDAS